MAIREPAAEQRIAAVRALQPLLHAADRRAAQEISRQPLLARRSARALRDRERPLADRKRVGRALDLDAGYLSRVLRNFEKRGLIATQGVGAATPGKAI